jgi:hypothetical protein
MVEANCASSEVSLGLRGCKIPSKKGAERAEIDRQREQASVDTGVHLVFERLKSCETLHQFPDVCIIGMKDMRSVHMLHDTRFGVAFGMAVTAQMVRRFHDMDQMPGFGQGSRYGRA